MSATRSTARRTPPRTPNRTAHQNNKRKRPSRARKPRRSLWPWAVTVAVVGAVAGMLFLGRSTGGGVQARDVGSQAPAFTLTSTSGGSVSLSAYRGLDVLLYFSEGVGCDACFYQMAELERDGQQLAAMGITVIPIAVNPASDVRREMARFGLRTPFLIDSGEAVSNAYGVVGTGMHENLPGHSFVLVDGSGRIRWRRDYPSMFVTVPQLIADMGSQVP